MATERPRRAARDRPAGRDGRAALEAAWTLRPERGALTQSERSGHEHAVRILDVVREGPAAGEPEARIEPLGGLEGGQGSRLQAEPLVAATPGLLDDPTEDGARHALAEV